MYSISESIFSREENLVYLKQIMIDCKLKKGFIVIKYNRVL